MNFGKNDLLILLTMSLAVIGMSFVFPALGLTTSDSVNETEIPEFEIDADRFDFVGAFPTRPGTPTSGVLQFDSSISAEGSDNVVWLTGDTSSGREMFLSEESSGTAQVTINEWDSGSVVSETNNTFSTENDTFILVSGEYGVRIDAETVEPPVYEAEYTLTSRPEDYSGFLGSVLGTVDATAQTLAWFGEILYWISVTIIEITVNTIGLIVDTMLYLVGLVTFLASTYAGIVSSAQGFASVFVAIPGIILGVELGKIVFIGINLLPTT
jgi:hypothetical protein